MYQGAAVYRTDAFSTVTARIFQQFYGTGRLFVLILNYNTREQESALWSIWAGCWRPVLGKEEHGVQKRRDSTDRKPAERASG